MRGRRAGERMMKARALLAAMPEECMGVAAARRATAAERMMKAKAVLVEMPDEEPVAEFVEHVTMDAVQPQMVETVTMSSVDMVETVTMTADWCSLDAEDSWLLQNSNDPWKQLL